MAWWFAAPLVIWGVKKIYDAVTEDDEPSNSSSSSSSSKLSSAKTARAQLRKKLIREAILKNRMLLISNTFSNKESETIKLDGSSTADDILDLPGIDVALENLYKTINILNPALNDSTRKTHNSFHVFTDLNEEVNEVAKKVDDSDGSMVGINHCNEYDSNLDPFVAKLKRVLA